MTQSKLSGARGFTLIELLVVIAIIGLLSSVVLASLNSARQKGRDARRIADIKQEQLALELYYDATGGYPVGTATALAAALVPSYIAAVPQDPTNSGAYIYAYQSADAAGAACSTVPCASYFARATLETAHTVLNGDIDGAFAGTAAGCEDATKYFCAKP